MILTRLLTGKNWRSQDRISDFLRGEDCVGANTTSGVDVTVQGSLQLTAVYSCVRIIAWTLASLPLPVYERTGPRSKERKPDDPLYKLLHDSPNRYQTSFQWRSITATHQNLWGAGISEIEFDRAGNPVALWPLPPWKVTPMRSREGEPFYRVSLDGGGTRDLLSFQVLIVTTLSTSSHEWLSPISLHRETIGAAKAVNEFGAKMFGQGLNPAGIVEYPGKISENSEKSMREKLGQYSGLGQAHRVMLLDQGMKFERVGLPPEDAQYLETRRFDVSEIARIFNVPLFMLQDHEKQTSWGSGIEEQKDGFVTFTLRPYVVQWEQEINKKLFFSGSRFAEFVLEGLLRGKISDRVEAYKKLWELGSLSPNDIRELENWNPIEGGDTYFVPLNFRGITEEAKNAEGE